MYWNGKDRIYVHASSEFKNKVSGLCGTFNHRQDDDFRAPDSAIETSAVKFGNSWKSLRICFTVGTKFCDNYCKYNLFHRFKRLFFEMKKKIIVPRFLRAHQSWNPLEVFVETNPKMSTQFIRAKLTTSCDHQPLPGYLGWFYIKLSPPNCITLKAQITVQFCRESMHF